MMASGVSAFTSNRPAFTNLQRARSTSLNIGLETEDRYAAYGEPKKRRRRGLEDEIDPEKDFTKYIQAPEPVAGRPNLDGTVLVSGWVHTKERTDQEVFDLLNHEDAVFHFDSICAFVDDEKFAKKRLLSRSARYTGLLDKLSLKEANKPGALPTADQLEGVKSWVANVEVGEDPAAALVQLKEIAAVATTSPSTVENVAVLVSNAAGLMNVEECVASIKALDDMENVQFTVVAVGELDENPEGSRPYEIADFGTEGGVVPAGAKFSRAESLRVITECLALKSGADKAFTFTEVVDTVNNTAAKLVKGLREAGYTRPQEIDHMITAGVANYTNAIEAYKQKVYDLENPDPEIERKKKEEEDRISAENFAKQQEEYEQRKKDEINEIARSWAKREYFRKSMSGNMGMTEEEYIESVWERAMFEGDLKYRMMHGGRTDERAELSEFLAKQELKKEAALKRAREALEGSIPDLVPSGDDDDKEDDE